MAALGPIIASRYVPIGHIALVRYTGTRRSSQGMFLGYELAWYGKINLPWDDVEFDHAIVNHADFEALKTKIGE